MRSFSCHIIKSPCYLILFAILTVFISIPLCTLEDTGSSGILFVSWLEFHFFWSQVWYKSL